MNPDKFEFILFDPPWIISLSINLSLSVQIRRLRAPLDPNPTFTIMLIIIIYYQYNFYTRFGRMQRVLISIMSSLPAHNYCCFYCICILLNDLSISSLLLEEANKLTQQGRMSYKLQYTVPMHWGRSRKQRSMNDRRRKRKRWEYRRPNVTSIR